MAEVTSAAPLETVTLAVAVPRSLPSGNDNFDMLSCGKPLDSRLWTFVVSRQEIELMVELIRLVDESLARHGFGALPQDGHDLCPAISPENSLGSGILSEAQVPVAPNRANAPGEGIT